MKTLKDLLNSKKFLAGFVTSGFLFLGQFFPAWSQSGDPLQGLAAVDWQVVMLPILTAIGAQGIADFGKERAKIVNENLAAAGMAAIKEE